MSVAPVKDYEANVQKGREHLIQGEIDKAEKIFRDVLSGDPEHKQALYNLGLLLVGKGDKEAALDCLKRAADDYREDAKYWCNIGNVYYPLGRMEEAVQAWENALALDENLIDTRVNLAHTLATLGRFEEAEKHAREALAQNPELPGAYLNLANALVRQEGRLEEAIKAWEKGIEIDPDNSQLYHNMGFALQNHGRLAEAEKCFREILRRHPDSVSSMNNLANILREQRKTEEAEEIYQRAIDLEPENGQLYNNLCLCLTVDNRYREAALVARQALECNPEDQRACINLSNCLRYEGKIEEAEKWARKAVKIAPDSAQTLYELAEVMIAKDRYVEAESLLKKIEKLPNLPSRSYIMVAKAYLTLGAIEYAMDVIDKAVEINPELPDAYYIQSTIYHMMNRIDDSIGALKKGIALQPDFIMPYLNLCDLYLAKGDKDSARRYLKDVMAINPDIPEAYHFLKYLKKFTADDPDFKRLQEFEKNEDTLENSQKIFLFYTLFKAYEDIGDYDRAFANLKKANDLQGMQHEYSIHRDKEVFNSVKELFTPAYVAEKEKKGHPSEAPVFVLGMPRSGTTLTEQILAAHPDVFGAGEANVIQLIDLNYGTFKHTDPYKRAEMYLQLMEERCPQESPKRIVDKTPINYRRIGEIYCMFPHAKIIHCRRDPVDVGFSCYKQHFSIGQYWSYDFDDIIETYKLYMDIMDHWRNVFPGRFLEIDYEETVNNFEEQARRLIDFVDLPWNDACLEPHKARRDVITASKTQVTRPIYKSSVKAWKRYETHLQPLIEGLKEFI